MKKEISTFWFIEPLDDHTNSVLSREIGNKAPIRGRVCADSKPHNLWPCLHLEVERLEASKISLQLRFRIFVQHGPRGSTREWKFSRTHKRKKAYASAVSMMD